jgi:hypothetical protein
MDKIEATIFNMMKLWFSNVIEETLKQQLDTNHLYQNLIIVFPEFESVFKSLHLNFYRRLDH